MGLIRLGLIDIPKLTPEFVQQRLEGVQDLGRLELVAGDGGRAVDGRPLLQEAAADALLLLHEGGEDPGHARDGARHFLEHGLRLGTVVVLRGQDRDSLLQGLHRLGIVLGDLEVLLVLLLAVVRGLLLLLLQLVDLGIQTRDLVAELLRIAVGLGREGDEFLDLGRCVLDFKGKVLGLLVGPPRVLVEGLFLLLLGGHACDLHVAQHTHDLLRRCDALGREGQGRGQEGPEA
mmetsp:Transcript_18820/g.65602  ORF Transcript_18820/g.65602 Transcript_18820/m.65602 type:complete len:233 (-) Transcript_18820:57-755(-)